MSSPEDFYIKKLLDDIDLKNTSVDQNCNIEESLRLELALIQAQIKPHFIYNAINTISAFSLDDPKMARDLLANLSRYLRGCLDFKNRDKIVTLSKELELVEAYLFIEKARFGDRLQVIYDIDTKLECMLPSLALLSLVEISVQYGLETFKHGGTLKITTYNENNFAIIAVEEKGSGVQKGMALKLYDEESQKTALENINQRLKRIYGIGLIMEQALGGGMKTSIFIPLNCKDPMFE